MGVNATRGPGIPDKVASNLLGSDPIR